MPGSQHIAVLSEDFPPSVGGIAQWAFGVARSLGELGYDVTVFTRRRWTRRATSGLDGSFRLRPMPEVMWRKSRYLSSLHYCLKFGSVHRGGVVIASTWFPALGAVMAGLVVPLRVVTVLHGQEVTHHMRGLKRRRLAFTLGSSALVVAVSRFTRSQAAQCTGLDPARIVVIPNGVDARRFSPVGDTDALRQRWGLQHKQVILTLARVVERKGHDTVIRALPQILAACPDAVYMIVGSWHASVYTRLQKLVASLGLEDKVVFTGYVPDDQLGPLYSLCDVYVMVPSRQWEKKGDTEGFGITYLEAGACGKPVIGGRVGGVADAVVDGVTGYLVEPDDPEQIAGLVVRLLKDRALAARLGAHGRQRAVCEHDWLTVTKRILCHLNPAKPATWAA